MLDELRSLESSRLTFRQTASSLNTVRSRSSVENPLTFSVVLRLVISLIFMPLAIGSTFCCKSLLPSLVHRYSHLRKVFLQVGSVLWISTAVYIPVRYMSHCDVYWAEPFAFVTSATTLYIYLLHNWQNLSKWSWNRGVLSAALKEALPMRVTLETNVVPTTLCSLLEQRYNDPGTTMYSVLNQTLKETNRTRDFPPNKGTTDLVNAWTPLRILSSVVILSIGLVYPISVRIWIALGKEDPTWTCELNDWKGLIPLSCVQIAALTTIWVVNETLRMSLHFNRVAGSDIDWLIAASCPNMAWDQIEKMFTRSIWLQPLRFNEVIRCACTKATQITEFDRLPRFNPLHNIPNLQAWWQLRHIHVTYLSLMKATNNRVGAVTCCCLSVGLVVLIALLTIPLSPFIVFWAYTFNVVILYCLILITQMARINNTYKATHLRFLNDLLIDLSYYQRSLLEDPRLYAQFCPGGTPTPKVGRSDTPLTAATVDTVSVDTKGEYSRQPSADAPKSGESEIVQTMSEEIVSSNTPLRNTPTPTQTPTPITSPPVSTPLHGLDTQAATNVTVTHVNNNTRPSTGSTGRLNYNIGTAEPLPSLPRVQQRELDEDQRSDQEDGTAGAAGYNLQNENTTILFGSRSKPQFLPEHTNPGQRAVDGLPKACELNLFRNMLHDYITHIKDSAAPIQIFGIDINYRIVLTTITSLLTVTIATMRLALSVV